MKVTYKEILAAAGPLGKLMDRQLPVREAIELARLAKKLNEELALLREQQARILNHAAEPTKKQLQQLEELLELEVELDAEPVEVTVDEIDAGTVLATEAFLVIRQKEEGD